MTEDIVARLRNNVTEWIYEAADDGRGYINDAPFEAADEIERLRGELAAERERLDFIETYVKARAEEHEFLSGMAAGALSGKKQRVRAHEASTILGRIREVRK